MAERRMFQVRMLRSGSFMRLSWGAAYLYVQLCAEADDDGFTDNADQICRLCRCSRKHMQELLDGGWLIAFDSGVTVITHWHRHNKIPKDRYKPTDHTTERSLLEKDETGAYVRLDTTCTQNVYNLYTQDR